jgi:hypothetical protein
MLLLIWLLPFALLPQRMLKLSQVVCFGAAAVVMTALKLQDGTASLKQACTLGVVEALFQTASVMLFLKSFGDMLLRKAPLKTAAVNAVALAIVHYGLAERCGCGGASAVAAAVAKATATGQLAPPLCRVEDIGAALASSTKALEVVFKSLTRNYERTCAATCEAASYLD